MKNISAIFALLVLSVFVLPAQDVPHVISYQGVLTDASGKPQSGSKSLTFKLHEKNGALPNTWIETISPVTLNGGLFQVPLGINSTPKGFPSLDGEYDLVVSVDGGNFNVPLYSAVYALNIPDNVVTTAKIKDGAVLSQKIADRQITATKLANGSVTTGTLAPGKNDGDILQWSAIANSWQLSSIPVGTIFTYAGEMTLARATFLHTQGWYLCDGSALPSDATVAFKAIAQESWSGKLPDLRGYFLRGADPSAFVDPTPRSVGSFEDGTTKMPNNGFYTDFAGAHSHSIQLFLNTGGNYSYNVAGGSSDATRFLTHPDWNNFNTSTDGSHNHTILGGDSETRPKNIAVNYIIKVK